MDKAEHIRKALEDALQAARTNRLNKEPAISLAYDSGRVAGLEEALEILTKGKT